MRHYRTHGRVMRVFKCPYCQYVTRASKRADQRTSRNHRKSMYCPFCKKIVNFVQISR